MDKIAKIFIILITITSQLYAQRLKSDETIQLANEYYLQQDFEKALDLYEKLSKDKPNIPLIHSNYFNLLTRENNISEAEKYIVKVIKLYPADMQYQTDLLYLYHYSGNEKAKLSILNQLVDNYKGSQYQLSLLAQQVAGKQMTDEAIFIFINTRKITNNPHAYAIEMAALYRIKNDREKMVSEYINFAVANPGNVNYIKNILQNFLTEEADYQLLQTQLINRLQSDAQNIVYPDLLVWVSLQRKDFYSAFMQARAIDKRTARAGDESMKVASVAMQNSAWSDAIDIYDYIINSYGDGYHYANARQKRLECKEKMISNTFPVNRNEIRTLSYDYYQLYQELSTSPVGLTALRNKAMLHAFHLEEMDSAIALLNYLIDYPRVNKNLMNQCKMDLGDIYILVGNPWEASLLYSQVEKQNKYAEQGYEAKLKNAKMHYYSGNFELAKGHLSVLKKATTKRIANDALDLEVFISNAIAFDSSDQVLKKYSDAELQVFQKKDEKAYQLFSEITRQNPTHPVSDDAFWHMANIQLRMGNYVQAVNYLDKIVSQYPHDVLADDAAFLKAEIFENNIEDKSKASELYRKFLTEYPGSMYVAEARKRFRIIRGDSIN